MAAKEKPVDFVEASMPALMDRFALGLPCREMCDAVTASCNCGRPTLFKDMMSVLERRKKATDGRVEGVENGKSGGMQSADEAKKDLPFDFASNVSLVTATKVFKKIMMRPVCELFVPKVSAREDLVNRVSCFFE